LYKILAKHFREQKRNIKNWLETSGPDGRSKNEGKQPTYTSKFNHDLEEALPRLLFEYKGPGEFFANLIYKYAAVKFFMEQKRKGILYPKIPAEK